MISTWWSETKNSKRDTFRLKLRWPISVDIFADLAPTCPLRSKRFARFLWWDSYLAYKYCFVDNKTKVVFYSRNIMKSWKWFFPFLHRSYISIDVIYLLNLNIFLNYWLFFSIFCVPELGIEIQIIGHFTVLLTDFIRPKMKKSRILPTGGGDYNTQQLLG